MDDWDPFADPADAPPAPPAPPAPVPVAVPVAVEAVPVEEASDIPDLPSLAELEEQLQVQLDSCPELVQAAFAGDEAKVQAGAKIYTCKSTQRDTQTIQHDPTLR